MKYAWFYIESEATYTKHIYDRNNIGNNSVNII